MDPTDAELDDLAMADLGITGLQHRYEAVEAVNDMMIEVLQEVVNAAMTVADCCAICGCDLDATPPHYSGCAIEIANAALVVALERRHRAERRLRNGQ